MLYLTIIGGVFIAWLILAVLFMPHIPYHIESAIDARSRSAGRASPLVSIE